MNATARRTLPLVALALVLAWVALSLTAGGPRLGAVGFIVRPVHAHRPAWPLWAHSAPSVSAAPAIPNEPAAAMRTPTEPQRTAEAAVAVTPAGAAVAAPGSRLARAFRDADAPLFGIALRVPLPPPRSG